MKHLAIGAVCALMAAPVLAEGDAAAGETQFNRQCVSCHIIQDAAGETLAGRNAATGPNLFGIAGGVPGHIDSYDYSPAIVAWAETGAVVDEEVFVGFLANPTNYLRDVLGDNRARSKMAHTVRNEQQARDIFAFIASLGTLETE